jgi:hypothetical protein
MDFAENLVERNKRSIQEKLAAAEQDNIFLNLGCGQGWYMFGRKKNGVIELKGFSGEQNAAIKDFTEGCKNLMYLK